MSSLVCDGCGRPASAEHIAARIERLQSSTRFRPIHIHTLFVAEAPGPGKEEDYGALLDVLGIFPVAKDGDAMSARLTEFQRRGYYLAFLVECPLDEPAGFPGKPEDKSGELCKRFGPTLVRRIQFSYRPKQIVLLSAGLVALVNELQKAGMGESLLLDKGAPPELPRAGTQPGQGEGSSVWRQLQSHAPSMA